MKQAKGCGNTKCVANSKKISFKSDDKFCPKCGENLIIVCKKCRVPLPEGCTDAYCVRCEAEREDRKDKAFDVAKKAGAGVVAVGSLAVSIVGAVVKKK